LEKSFSSLAGCYAMLVALAALFLAYARLDFPLHPSDWSGLIPRFLRGSFPGQDLRGSELLASMRTAVAALRNRMHTTWFFFLVFTTVWLACLLWMLIERRRRKLNFSLQEAYWMVWISLAVFSVAVLYGLGTNGILARRFPGLVIASDLAALGFMLTLPLAAWSRIYFQEDERAARGEPAVPRGKVISILGLDGEESSARLVESFSRLEVRPVDLLPAVQIFNPEPPSENAKAVASRLIGSADLPVVGQPAEPVLSVPAPQPVVLSAPATPPVILPAPAAPPVVLSAPAVPPVVDAANETAAKGSDGFRESLSVLNRSWQRIQHIGQEIEEWFDQQRRQAIAHLELPPGLRGPQSSVNLSRDFPNEKLTAVDAEWAAIRRAALEISRWFGDAPAQGGPR
jgi:hypothetical protein